MKQVAAFRHHVEDVARKHAALQEAGERDWETLRQAAEDGLRPHMIRMPIKMRTMPSTR